MDPLINTITFSVATIVFALVLLHFFMRIGRAENDVKLIKQTVNSMLVTQVPTPTPKPAPTATSEVAAVPETITSTGSLFLRHNPRGVSAPFAAAAPVPPPVFVPGSTSLPPSGLTPIQNLWEAIPSTSPTGVAVVVLAPTSAGSAG